MLEETKKFLERVSEFEAERKVHHKTLTCLWQSGFLSDKVSPRDFIIFCSTSRDFPIP